MILIFCFTVIITSAYYAYNYLKRKKKPLPVTHKKDYNKGNCSTTNINMSDDKKKGLGTNVRWNQENVNKVAVKNQGGLFRWKRMPPSNIPDVDEQKSEKRQKIRNKKPVETNVTETIELSEDEFEASRSDKDTSNNEIKVYDEPTSSNSITIDSSSDESISPVKKSVESDTSYSKINSSISIPIYEYKPKRANVPLPKGMPPIIAGVPMQFPITPYKSQISVMNAIIKGCKNKEHCLLESPTGSGKTLALLCGALAWQEYFKDTMFTESKKKSKNHDADGAGTSCQPGKSNDGCCKETLVFDDFKDKEETYEAKIPKIYYGSRTHKQIEQVIREFRKTAYADKPMTILSSRELTCIQKVDKGISKTKLCNDLHDPKHKRGCEYYKNENKTAISSNGALSCLGFETPWDIEDLVTLGKERRACPYFAARALMAEADIIFCPYNYLIDPVIRDTMKIDLLDDVIIIDEAHNIESICRDVGSVDLREDHLNEAIEDCKLVGNLTAVKNPLNAAVYECLEHYLKVLNQVIQEEHLPESSTTEEVSSACWTGEEIWTLFKMKGLGDEHYQQFERACKQAINDYNQLKEDIQTGTKQTDEDGKKKHQSAITFVTVRLLEELLMALAAIQDKNYHKEYRSVISRSYCHDAKVKVQENTWITNKTGGKYLRILKFMCMNPALVFSKMAQKTRCVILASGTLSPTSTFESELGTKFTHKLHANHVVPKEQVYVRGIGNGPSGTKLKATYQNVQMLPFKDDLGRLLVDVCQSVPHGVLCFFSSYSMMTSQIERWQETDVWYELEQCKHVFQEPRFNNDLDETMSEFREVIKFTADKPSKGITGALLFAVFRGKVAEGIDFSDNEARCVLTIGIPYAVRNDPVVKLKLEYNDVNRNKGLLPGGEWYSVQAYRALNQALGRCIRHRNDWGAVLLVDERLLSPYCASYLPKWIREMKLEGSNYNLKEELKAFVKKQKVRDIERTEN